MQRKIPPDASLPRRVQYNDPMHDDWKTIEAPPHFQLDATVLSHGWVFLAPFLWDGTTLSFPFRAGRRKVTIQIRAQGKSIAFSPPSKEVEAVVRWVLRLDEDLQPLALHASHDALIKIALRKGAGRLLRAPTLWEEATRILCTTNMQWGGTIAMMQGLVAIGGGLFPTPRQVLAAGVRRLQTEARMGYRAGFLVQFATRLESGYQLEAWKNEPPSLDTLTAEIRGWPGFGPYATAHMLVQLGHYGALPIDSEVRAFHQELWGTQTTDARIRGEYAAFGPYAFLVYKLRRIGLRKNWIGD